MDKYSIKPEVKELMELLRKLSEEQQAGILMSIEGLKLLSEGKRKKRRINHRFP